MSLELLNQAKSWLNDYYKSYEAWQIVLSTALTLVVLSNTVKVLNLIMKNGLKKTVLGFLFSILKKIPGAAGQIDKENEKMLHKMEKMVLGKHDQGVRHYKLPASGESKQALFDRLQGWRQEEEKIWKTGRVSGTVYHGGDELKEVASSAYAMFASSNPLHPDVFPYVRKMEAEVVRMCVSLYNGDEQCCGAMTSGGTESILLACKSYRDAGIERGIQVPEIIVPSTVHAAFDKAAHYFGFKLIHIPVRQTDFKADVKATERAINSNTVALVGSAPCYPQGVIDPITELAVLARKYKLGLHVDCCLGSFLLPHLEELGYKVPLYDFRVPEVTSISMDPHKYGFTPKGSSVVMYRNSKLRQYQYFVAGDWSGGIYASPTIAGSRPGGLVAGTWATMMHMGKDGYRQVMKEIMEAAVAIKEGIESIDGLKLLGNPDMSVICFTTSSSSVDIYKVAEALTKRHWNLNSLQFPRCVHICVTYLHTKTVNEFLRDVKDSLAEVKSSPGAFDNGSAAIYGMAESIPDRSMVSSLTKGFLDTLYKV